jgi:hypothetical protein
LPRIQKVESFIISIPRDTPYLGPLGPGEQVNARGYLVRQGNRTIGIAVLQELPSENGEMPTEEPDEHLVFIGVLGGILAFGFIGIFIGPTLLALAFALLQQWINSEAPPPVHYPPDD